MERTAGVFVALREESAEDSRTAEQVGDRKERQEAVREREQRGKVLPEATGRQTVKCTLLPGYTLNRQYGGECTCTHFRKNEKRERGEIVKSE